MECFIFAETLYSFTNLMVKYPIRSLITKVSKLLPYSATAQKSSTSWTSGVNYSYVGRHLSSTIWTIGLIIHLVLNYFNHQVNLFALQVPVFGHLPKYLQFGLLDSSFIQLWIIQPSKELGAIHEELKYGCVHYDTTTCSIPEKWFTWLTVLLYNKIWKTTFKLPESLLFPALT